MKLGIFEQIFGFQGEAAFTAVRKAGFHAVQFDLATVGLPTLPDAIPEGILADVRSWSATHEVVIAGVHGTFNMIDPDPVAKAEGLRRLVRLIEAAPETGTSVVTLCTGTRNTDSMWRSHPANADPEAWRDLRATLDVALDAAERAKVVLGVEPEPANVVATAALGRRLMDEVRSPHLGIIADPANMLLGMDVDRPAESLARAFDIIGDSIVMAHGKDLTADGQFAPVGRGVVPWDDVRRHFKASGTQGALILHGLAPNDLALARMTLQDAGFDA